MVGPSYNILKGTCRSYVELDYNMEECYKVLTDQLDWNNLESDRYTFDLSKPLPLVMVSKHDVYSTKRILVVTNVKVKEWYGYGHLEEIKVQRSDQKLYMFMEGDFPRLYLHDIKDILILLV
ncbi:hypothetical protein Tco_1187189 [Tanacetum coccineum]